MPKRSSTPKLDTVQNARRVFLESVETTEISIVQRQVMSDMGRKGGLIGGKRRLETMTSSQRSAIATKAAKARWAKAKKNSVK